MSDEWRKIPGIPERFEIAKDGSVHTLAYDSVRSSGAGAGKVRRMPAKQLKPFASKTKTGVRMRISLHGTPGSKALDYLVALAWLGAPYDLNSGEHRHWRINHKDGDCGNCHVDNLEWVASNAPKGVEDDSKSAWERVRVEPVRDWLLKFYREDEIDWDESKWVLVG